MRWDVRTGVAILGVLVGLLGGGYALLANNTTKTEESSPSDRQGIVEPPRNDGSSGLEESPTTPTPPTVEDGIDYDCGDFASHQEAQEYFESQGGSASNNVDLLDRDRDGLACEAS